MYVLQLLTLTISVTTIFINGDKINEISESQKC